MRNRILTATFLSIFTLFCGAAYAEDYVITVEKNQFSPANLTIPAGQKVKVIVKNKDSGPIEFESHDFNREKVIPGNKEATIVIGPLKEGSYSYFDEFHPTAKGTITATAATDAPKSNK